MAVPTDSYLSGSNIDFLETLYVQYLKDPASVDPSFVPLFQNSNGASAQAVFDVAERSKSIRPVHQNGVHAVIVSQAPSNQALQSKIDQALFSFRLRGHLLSRLDPLGTARAPLSHVADMPMTNDSHFTEEELNTVVDTQLAFDAPVPARLVIDRMRKTYTETIGVEYLHMMNSERRRWLMRRMESCENKTQLSPQEARRVLERLTQAEVFEQTVHTKFQAAKRFSLEGGDALIPMLDALLELGGELGLREVVIGMAHRGRLNVLTNIMNKSSQQVFSEFLGPEDPKAFLNRGDVKYHMGFSSDYKTTRGKIIHLSMAFNPSHLGIVHPVVEGRVRAKQDRMGESGPVACMPLVIHGDAAFSGQGLVAETLNFERLKGYSTGGTVHIVVNNQVGYTTEADQGRTPLYCTGMAQLLDIPVFHVNGDDAEACVHVMRLATEFRQKFQSDVVIDLVCYRKYGHNEGDEPAFTQPKMYEAIRAHATPRAIYAQKLSQESRLSSEESAEVLKTQTHSFSEAHSAAKTKNMLQDPSHNLGLWAQYRGGPDADSPQVDTGVSKKEALDLLLTLSQTPNEFVLHKGVAQVLERRKQMAQGQLPLDWAAGELLAYATLLKKGYGLRLTGQDTERGTFSHRHAVLHDTATGKTYYILREFVTQMPNVVMNSPLSEMGCLGFEFGYSLDAPDTLVLWEAQFGDFANNAQVVIDQFIAAAEDKWKRLCGLTLLLPHGYEGAGPEHSSARLERFLELAAEDNMQVCYPTSSAQIFHLLRRQMLRTIRKPLVVMTPKSLLRMQEASAPVEAFTSGRFARLISETNPAVDLSKAKRLLLVSGKVYFDLVKAREIQKNTSIAIARLEQLYPLPKEELEALLKSMKGLKEVYWVQEEPKNSGAWRYLIEPLQEILGEIHSKVKLRYAGRVESASPATGFPKTHEYEQKLLIEQALAEGN